MLPTTPIVAPKLAEVAAPDEFGRKNALLLRNTNPVNFFDLCAISLPLPRQDGLSTGLMLVGRNGAGPAAVQYRRSGRKARSKADERLMRCGRLPPGLRPSTMNAKANPSGE